MKLPRVRFSMKTMMVAVAVAGWVSFNAYLFSDLEAKLPRGQSGRVWIVTALAFAVCPSAGGVFAWIVWRSYAGHAVRLLKTALRGAYAGAAAGAVSWFAATVLLGIAHDVYGQMGLAAIILSAEGAVLHAVVGALLAVIFWRPPPPISESEDWRRGPLPEFLQSVDPPDSRG